MLAPIAENAETEIIIYHINLVIKAIDKNVITENS